MQVKINRFIAFVICCTPLAAPARNEMQGKLYIDSNAKAQLFAPGVISTPDTEWATSFSTDEKTVYSSRGAVYWTIISSTTINGKWQQPQVIPFSGRWRDTDPFITPDGRKMFFISNRPTADMPQNKAQVNFYIWYADKNADGTWEMPQHLDSFINVNDASNFAPSVDNNGNLYFCSRDRHGIAGMSSYCSKLVMNAYQKPELISIKGVDDIQDPFIAPDGRYLLFVSGNDLYVSYKESNEWTPAEKLVTSVNNGDGNSSPYISHDEKMMYYSTARMQGFYKRDPANHALDYDELEKENESEFNGQTNILMIPVEFTNSRKG